MPLYMVMVPNPTVPGPETFDVQATLNGSLIGGLRVNRTELATGPFPLTFTETGLPRGTLRTVRIASSTSPAVVPP